MIRIPKFYRIIIKYVTPLFLLIILTAWLIQDGLPFILMKNVAPENRTIVLAVRVILGAIFLALVIGVWAAWKKRGNKTEEAS